MSQTKPAAPAMYKTNAAFAVLLCGMVGYFVFWGLGYTNHNHVPLFLLATAFGVFMAFNIGGNDVANSFGTSVGAGTLTVPQALIIAAVFEVSGAVIAGGEVTHTIRSGIVNLESLPLRPLDLVFIMMSALLAAALWLLFATKKGLPVSTTHAIVGGIVGSSLCLGFLLAAPGSSPWAMVQWDKIGTIAVSWVLSPLLGGAVAYLLFSLVKKYVLDYNASIEEQLKAIKAEKKAYKESHKHRFEAMDEQEKIEITSAMARDAQIYGENDFDPAELESAYYRGLYAIDSRKNSIDAYKAMYSWVPAISAIGGMVISSMLIFKGLSNLKLGVSTLTNTLIIMMIGAAIWVGTFIYAKTLKRKDISKSTFLMFSWMQVFTASGFAFSHGANDIANAIGPFAAIMDVLRTGSIGSDAAVPPEAGRAAPVFRFRRRAGRRLGGDGRFRVRPAGIQHPYFGRRRTRHRPGQPQCQLENDETHRPGVGGYPAGRRAAGSNQLFRPAQHILGTGKPVHRRLFRLPEKLFSLPKKQPEKPLRVFQAA